MMMQAWMEHSWQHYNMLRLKVQDQEIGGRGNHLPFHVVEVSCLLLGRKVGNIQAFAYGLACKFPSCLLLNDSSDLSKATLAKLLSPDIPAPKL